MKPTGYISPGGVFITKAQYDHLKSDPTRVSIFNDFYKDATPVWPGSEGWIKPRPRTRIETIIFDVKIVRRRRNEKAE